jgi:hypothetical protein
MCSTRPANQPELSSEGSRNWTTKAQSGDIDEISGDAPGMGSFVPFFAALPLLLSNMSSE